MKFVLLKLNSFVKDFHIWQWIVLIAGFLLSLITLGTLGFLETVAVVTGTIILVFPIRKRIFVYLTSIATLVALLALLLNNLTLADSLLKASFIWCVALTGWLIAHYRYLPEDETQEVGMYSPWGVEQYSQWIGGILLVLSNAQKRFFIYRTTKILFYTINVALVAIYLFIFGIDLPSDGTSFGFTGFLLMLLAANAFLWWRDRQTYVS